MVVVTLNSMYQKKKKQNKIPKTTTIYCPANSLTLNRK